MLYTPVHKNNNNMYICIYEVYEEQLYIICMYALIWKSYYLFMYFLLNRESF